MRFAIGIDLGTTHSALAWMPIDSSRSRARVETLPIPQLVDLGETEDRPLLPSFAYLPGEDEFPRELRKLPWSDGSGPIVGEAARRLGSKVPGRLVSSAKSWLCHPNVDRRAAILPWQTEIELDPISPLGASALYLSHLKNAWNHGPGSGSANDRMEEQTIVLTIPASFDEVARELTVEAARIAGLPKIVLLEEPQAAFYQWLEQDDPNGPLPVGSTCVVIDCGGGTTDFSLLCVAEKEGRPSYQRLAVGDHLLLGGDNVDLAIARHVEQILSPDRRFDLGQWWNLVLDARRVKEVMLSPAAPERMKLTVLGRGRRVIGSSLSCELDRDLVRSIAIDGFFPFVPPEEALKPPARSGLREFGLPFAEEPAITRHLAQFLLRHQDAIRSASRSRDGLPDAILFNGGMFNAELCRARVLDVMRDWFGEDWQPRVLETSSLDLAVAQGAAHYALRRATGGERIKSGVSRAYYLGVASAEEPDTVLCVVPAGLDEGERVTISQPTLELKIGEPVAFPLFSSIARNKDQAGDRFVPTAGQLAVHPPITTLLRGGKRARRTNIPVRLEAQLTEIGTLELHCVAQDGNNRWRLQFQTRTGPQLAQQQGPTSPVALNETWSTEELDQAINLIHSVFETETGADPKNAVRLPRQIESALDRPRAEWTISLLRALWEPLASVAPQRARTVEHECRWYNLVGYCLRPGFGDPLDPFRVEQLWKIIHAGVVQKKQDSAWAEYWILCRRIAGGLDPSRQLELGTRLLGLLGLTSSRKSSRRIGSHEWAEIWRAASSLEHLPADAKRTLGRRLLEESRQDSPPVYAYWSLGRLGARVPVYAPVNVVLGLQEIEGWIQELLERKHPSPQATLDRDFALVQWARLTGDRGRDIDPDLREKVAEQLRNDDAPTSWQNALSQAISLDSAADSKVLGDSLPAGLMLAGNS